MNEQKLKEIAYYFDGYGSPHDDDILKLIDEYKRYREARAIIEQVYKESYVRNAYGYEDGFLDGLDTAINIIDEALEESS